MKFFVTFFFLGTLTLAAHAAETVDRLIAIVGTEMITLSDVKKEKNAKDALDKLIRDKLLKIEMENLSIKVSEEDIQNSITEVLRRNQITSDILKSELRKKGTSFESYKKELGEQIRTMKFMSQVIFPRMRISEDEINKELKGDPSEKARLEARIKILEKKSTVEFEEYLDELRKKTYVKILK